MSKKASLKIAKDLALPVSAVTETFGIIGIRGSGKTTTSRVVTEEMTEANQPVVVVDPLGVWYGLRSNSDGQSSGLPFVILGGEHGDLPLAETAGTRLAQVVSSSPASLVLDLSLMRKGAQRRFMTDFIEGLYHANRQPLHVVVDECDLFIPQRPVKGAERLVGAMEDLVRRGRARGLGVTLISQRPASIHKDVLSQVSVLVAHRLVGPQDRKALDAWVEANGTPEQRGEMMDTLAQLGPGEAWIWSPHFLDVFTRVQIRRPTTYDSSATPSTGAQRSDVVLTKVDVAQLEVDLAEEIDAADDPKRLKRKVASLERELAKATRERAPEQVEVQVEVPVIDAATADEVRARLAAIETDVAALGRVLSDVEARVSSAPRPSFSPRRQAPQRRQSSRPVATSPVDVEGIELKRGARVMLRRAAELHPLRVTWAQLAALANMKSTSGTFGSYKSALRTQGLLAEDGGLVEITEVGLAAAGVPADHEPLTPDELQEMWRSKLKAGARRMFDVVLDAYPQPVSKEELGEQAEISPTSGTFGSYLSTLRTNGLVEVDGQEVVATEILFLAGLGA